MDADSASLLRRIVNMAGTSAITIQRESKPDLTCDNLSELTNFSSYSWDCSSYRSRRSTLDSSFSPASIPNVDKSIVEGVGAG